MTPEDRLHVRGEIQDAVAVLTLEGELIAQTRYDVERILREWLEAGILHAIVRMPALRYIDSAGLSTLLGALHRYRRAGGDLVLAELNPNLEAIFEVESVEKFFRIYPSFEEARGHFTKADTTGKGDRS